MLRFNSLLLLCTCWIFLACEREVVYEGRVYDAGSGEPLTGARVEVLETDTRVRTDGAGYFHAIYVGADRQLTVRISHPDYQSFEIKRGWEGEYTVSRIRSGSYWVDLDSVFYPDPAKKELFIAATSLESPGEQVTVGEDGIVMILLEREDREEEFHAWNDMRAK
ncbi:MAG: carboxypeptidase-like regulatory domain-containing protein [Lewinella sp.]